MSNIVSLDPPMNVYQEKVIIAYGDGLDQFRAARRNGERKVIFIHVPDIFGVEYLPIRSIRCTERFPFDAGLFNNLVHLAIHTSVTDGKCRSCGTQMTDI